jgi:hypothetical protein
MLGRAAELQGKRSELLVSESLLILHDASEMVMQVVYDYHNIKAPKEFLQFWEKLPEAGLAKPDFRSAIRQLNELRVGFKHRGIIPNAGVVRKLDPEVRAFCSSLCTAYLDTEFDQLSLADLVQNQDVAGPLKKAELSYVEGKSQEAVIELEDALHQVWEWAKKSECIFTYGLALSGQRRSGNTISTFEPGLIPYLNLVLLGVDLRAYNQVSSILPGVSRSPHAGSKETQFSTLPSVTPEQFASALSFITDLALKVQGLAREPVL